MEACALVQRRTHSLKTKLFIKLIKFRNIRRFMLDGVEIKRQRHIAFHRNQHTAGWQPVERFAQIFADYTFDIHRIGNHAIERTIFSNPFRSGFGADFFNAGDVIDRIAHQRQVINNSVRKHAKFVFDTLDIQCLVRHGVDQHHALINQLRQVFVAGANDSFDATRCGMFGERTDNVVSFHTVNHHTWPA